MREHYLQGVFGFCPRVECGNQHVLPVGTSDELRVSRVKTFCPKCEQLYATKSKHSDVDGAYFGTSFPHIFCLTYPSLFPVEVREGGVVAVWFSCIVKEALPVITGGVVSSVGLVSRTNRTL